MDILKTLTHSLAAVDQPASLSGKQVVKVDNARPTAAEPIADRRYQPDRRRRQAPFEGPDRRRRGSRRRPLLLHPKTREATSLEDRRGRNISTQA